MLGADCGGDVSDTTVFVCGPPKDHACDDDGPFIYGLSDGSTTDSEERARKEGCSWGSATCSVCGISSMERILWEGP